MKVEANKVVNRSFPYVAEGNKTGLIVLMTGPSRGVILKQGRSIREVGEVCHTMNEEELTPCSVTITNE